ncbi:MAG: sigma-54-dependent Fis family transcriptional regulator [Flavobacteriales bacterium]|nr:sigma-54-dependent Fis family transcriptional regulator [Flavobacteriales bacterium]
MNKKIFIVEDDEWYGQMLCHHLGLNLEFEVSHYLTSNEMLQDIYKNPDIICIDLGLPDIPGDQLIPRIIERKPDAVIIVISGQDDISVAVNLLKNGAKDYIVKDEHTRDMLWKSIINSLETVTLKKEVEELREQLSSNFDFDKSIIGQSDAIKKVITLAKKATQSEINVSLTGETGSGKEVFAKAIHLNGTRKKKPFISVNMAAIPPNLMESELFGFEKGSFTGAMNTQKGKFEEADGGTLFLDEIGELDISLQSKLLRALQEREITRIGNHKPIPINIRLITATHKNLSDEVKQGKFREDLYYRIVGLPIEIPPLRKRGNDVILLAKHCVTEFSRHNKMKAPDLTEEARTKLRNHPFPGNVRELKAIIDLACVLCDGESIKADDINFYDINVNINFTHQEKKLEDYEIEIIEQYLDKNDWNVVRVANKLDIAKSKIYNLIKSGKLNKT